MALRMMQQVKTALSHLNPDDVRQEAERTITIGVTASSSSVYEQVERFLSPPQPGRLGRVVYRQGEAGAPAEFTLQFVENGIPHQPSGFSFDPDRLDVLVDEVLEQRPDLSLALARNVPPFRDPVARQIIKKIAKENAVFSLATAMPSVVPLLSLPLSIGEFASDTAFLTMNQIRMAFLLAAAHGRPIGYSTQKGEVASIIASAFGWRAIARELIGKIPMGGGLIPKAAIAYAGTFAVGLSIDKYLRSGIAFSDKEGKAAYEAALEKGKEIAAAILASVKQKQRA